MRYKYIFNTMNVLRREPLDSFMDQETANEIFESIYEYLERNKSK